MLENLRSPCPPMQSHDYGAEGEDMEKLND